MSAPESSERPDGLVEMVEGCVSDCGERLVDEAGDALGQPGPVSGGDRDLVVGVDRQEVAEPTSEDHTRCRQGHGSSSGFDEAVHCRVRGHAHEDGVEALRVMGESHFDAREWLRGRDRWVATGGGDELGGLAGGRVELAVGAVDGAVLAVQDVRDRVAQSGEHEHEAQRHRDADDGEDRAAPVAPEPAHDHPPARREVPHRRHDAFEQ